MTMYPPSNKEVSFKDIGYIFSFKGMNVQIKIKTSVVIEY